MPEQDIILKIKADTTELEKEYEQTVRKIEAGNERMQGSFDDLANKRSAEIRARTSQFKELEKFQKDELADLDELIRRRKDAANPKEFNEYNKRIAETEKRLKGMGVELDKTAVKQEKLGRGALEAQKGVARLTTSLRRMATVAALAFAVAVIVRFIKKVKEGSREMRLITETTDEFAKALGKAQAQSDKLFAKLKRLNPESLTFAKTIEKLKDEFGNFIALKPGATLDEITAAQERANVRLLETVRLRVLENTILKAQTDLIEAQTQDQIENTKGSQISLIVAEGRHKRILQLFSSEVEGLREVSDWWDEHSLAVERSDEAAEGLLKAFNASGGVISTLKKVEDAVEGTVDAFDSFARVLEDIAFVEAAVARGDEQLAIQREINRQKTIESGRQLAEDERTIAERKIEDDLKAAQLDQQLTDQRIRNILAVGSALGGLGSAFSQLSQTVGEETEAGASLAKAAALFNIAASQAVSIANVVQMATAVGAAAGPAGPILFAVTLAAGLAATIANITQALAILNSQPLPTLAEGTSIAQEGPTIVGERGKEIVYMPKGSGMFNNRAVRTEREMIDALNDGTVNDYLNRNYILPAITAAQASQKAEDQRQMEKFVKVYMDAAFNDQRLIDQGDKHSRFFKQLIKNTTPKDLQAPRSRYAI